MSRTRMRGWGALFAQAVAAALALVAVARPVFAQGSADYPVKPVRLVVSFPPGGATDVVARIVVARMGERLGQAFVVENRPGAGGIIAVESVVKSPPDGYTLLLGTTGTMAINPTIYRKLPYDPDRDLAAVSGMAKAPFVLLVPSERGASSVAELIALAKAKPGAMSYGSGGNGTVMHLSGELFRQMSGTTFVHVPFKGSGPASNAMMGGALDAVWVDLTTAQTVLKSGKVRALAITTAERTSLMPGVPTVAESGVAGFESIGWFGLWAPAGTPQSVIAKLHAASAAVLESAEMRERINATGNDPWILGPEALAAFNRAEIAKWGAVVKISGATAE